LKGRRYADAIESTRRSAPSVAERDFAVGVLVLEGRADARAVQPPRESVSQGLALIEASALAGHAQAVATLATTFAHGMGGMPGYAPLIAPDPRLGDCWNQARDRPERAAECVAMRAAR
jgi:hypothetical protein